MTTPEARTDEVTMEEVVALCKRRGFVFPSSEIYGGLGSTYDYGHYGVLLKNNVKAEWWRAMLQERDDIVTVDGQTMEDDTVTLRDRDSLEQTRVPISGLAEDLGSRLVQPWRRPFVSLHLPTARPRPERRGERSRCG
jgi:glycyl-tRNA synthetase (class II)